MVACDLDPLAIEACRANAALNGVELSYSPDFFAEDDRFDLIIVADVLYGPRQPAAARSIFSAAAARLWWPTRGSRIFSTRSTNASACWTPAPGRTWPSRPSSGNVSLYHARRQALYTGAIARIFSRIALVSICDPT